jgi:hypothetical protein
MAKALVAFVLAAEELLLFWDVVLIVEDAEYTVIAAYAFEASFVLSY